MTIAQAYALAQGDRVYALLPNARGGYTANVATVLTTAQLVRTPLPQASLTVEASGMTYTVQAPHLHVDGADAIRALATLPATAA